MTFLARLTNPPHDVVHTDDCVVHEHHHCDEEACQDDHVNFYASQVEYTAGYNGCYQNRDDAHERSAPVEVKAEKND